jgi:vitamin K-dependent gamma-carboxylase
MRNSSTYLVSAKLYSIFRMLFGLLMIPQIINLVPHVHDLAQSTFVFHYPYLDFINAYSHLQIDIMKYIALFGVILITVGVFSRLGAFLFLICFGYIFLIDMSFYNNHYYLWCLIAILFILSDVDKSISILDLIKKNTNKNIHITNYFTIGLLVSIVYFYGGIAKINTDWLQGYPMRLLAVDRAYPFPHFMGYFMSYFGLIFDLVIGFVLWIKPKSILVILPYFAFHSSNYFIFNIGEFPLVMMAAYLLFIPLSQFYFKELYKAVLDFLKWNIASVLLILFFIIQLVFPLRFLILFEDVAWHRQGHYFAWRMMLHNHEPKYFQFLVVMPDLDDQYMIQFDKLITYRQLVNTFNDPYFIWKVAQKLALDAKTKYKTQNVEVYCNSLITLNQHTEQFLINTDTNLAGIPYYFYKKNTFVNEFKP